MLAAEVQKVAKSVHSAVWKPIEKLVRQQDQIPANPQCTETEAKYKSAPLQTESQQ